MLRLIRNFIVVLALVIGVAFGFYNYDLTQVNLLWTTTQAPLVVLLAITFVLGFFIALLVSLAAIARMRAQLARVRRQLKDTRTEVSNLRSKPIKQA